MIYYSSDKILTWVFEFNLIVCCEIWYDLLTFDTINVKHQVTLPDFEYKPVCSSKNCYLANELCLKLLITLKNSSVENLEWLNFIYVNKFCYIYIHVSIDW